MTVQVNRINLLAFTHICMLLAMQTSEILVLEIILVLVTVRVYATAVLGVIILSVCHTRRL